MISEDTVSVERFCQEMGSELSFLPDFLFPHTLVRNENRFIGRPLNDHQGLGSES